VARTTALVVLGGESVTNIARHSGSATAALTLEFVDAGSLHVTVADTGRCAEPWTHGVGIESMHERVEQIGGTLTIRATLQGATVTADLPLAIPRDVTPRRDGPQDPVRRP
jgi:signal transduction histidine kinase